MSGYRKVVREIFENGLNAANDVFDREFDALVAAEILKGLRPGQKLKLTEVSS